MWLLRESMSGFWALLHLFSKICMGVWMCAGVSACVHTFIDSSAKTSGISDVSIVIHHTVTSGRQPSSLTRWTWNTTTDGLVPAEPSSQDLWLVLGYMKNHKQMKQPKQKHCGKFSKMLEKKNYQQVCWNANENWCSFKSKGWSRQIVFLCASLCASWTEKWKPLMSAVFLIYTMMYVSLCAIYLISISEQMLMSTPTKLTHSCTTPSSAAFRAPADTSCYKNTLNKPTV